MPKSNLNEPLKPTVKGVPFGIFIGGLAAYALAPIVLPMAANLLAKTPALSVSDAERAKDYWMGGLDFIVFSMVGYGGFGSVTSSLAARGGKIWNAIKGSEAGTQEEVLGLDDEPQAEEADADAPKTRAKARPSGLAKVVNKNG